MKRFDHVAVIDIGSTKNIGWAVDGDSQSSGTTVDEFVERIGDVARLGSVAVGFEAPMFVPFHSDATNLTRGRIGERDRAYTASAGACALTAALTIVPYIVSQLRNRLQSAQVTLDWHRSPQGGAVLFFEAFVSGRRPEATVSGSRHIQDAAQAVKRFREIEALPDFASDIHEPVRFNLLGAALLRSGWTRDPSVLSSDCLVVSASR